jgi:hypothetical protein
MKFIINGEQQPHGSLNRVQIPSHLPLIPQRFFNQSAYDLLSSQALSYIAEDKGEQIQEYSLRLATLLYVLHLGHQVQLDREDWGPDNWKYWSQIEQIILGGGILQHFGKNLCDITNYFLATHYKISMQVKYHPAPSEIVLHGLAFHAPSKGKHLLLDFGNTNIKYSILRNESPSPVMIVPSRILLSDSISGAIVSFISKLSSEQFDGIYMSLAAYVHQGSPVSSHGLYGRLKSEVSDFKKFLEDRLNMPGKISIYHDASVAADPYRGKLKTVIITLGTALGVGYI